MCFVWRVSRPRWGLAVVPRPVLWLHIWTRQGFAVGACQFSGDFEVERCRSAVRLTREAAMRGPFRGRHGQAHAGEHLHLEHH